MHKCEKVSCQCSCLRNTALPTSAAVMLTTSEPKSENSPEETNTLEQWFRELYNDNEEQDLTESDLHSIIKLIGELMRFDPQQRCAAQEAADRISLLQHR